MLRQLKTDVDNVSDLCLFLHHHLVEDIMPFWERFAIDDAGGINTCIADDGTLINRDKWL